MSTGEEVLRGELVDTNSHYLAQTLQDFGFSIEMMLTVGDRRDDLLEALTILHQRSDYIFVTGGLGPTSDDLTTELVAEFAGTGISFHQPSWQAIVDKFQMFNREPTENNRKQAYFPDGADVLANPVGTAAGFHLPFEQAQTTKHIIALPGPPRELKPVLQNFLDSLPAGNTTDALHVRLLGLGESEIAQRMSNWREPDHELSYRFQYPEVELKLYNPTTAVAANLKQFIFEQFETNLIELSGRQTPEVFSDYLRTHDIKFAVAESCTGGLFSKIITDQPGSSDYFLGGVVSYDNRIKTQILGVDAATIEQHGAVSEQVARQMALGVRQRFDADLSLSITGIAGPGGGSDEKPVGTVWMAFSTRGETTTRQFHFPNDRESIRISSVYNGMHWIMADWLRNKALDILAESPN